jgi:hypothetical protein
VLAVSEAEEDETLGQDCSKRSKRRQRTGLVLDLPMPSGALESWNAVDEDFVEGHELQLSLHGVGIVQRHERRTSVGFGLSNESTSE